ncbi:MAG: DUF1553 domain-containing protein [Planctomycetaceae bacterium]|nr:DUF1553 domain-containing protein [Planctomycetaceae bacterium]
MTSVGSARDVPNGANCLVSNARDSSSYAEAHLDEMELTTSKERDTMHCPRKILSYLLTLLLCCGFAAVAQAEIRVFPEQVQLTGAKARQQLIVQTVVDGELAAQPAEVTWTSDTPDVMTVSAEGVITPVKNGEAKATAKVGDETLAVSVQITGMDQPHAWEFRRHVVPILSKTGCNTGPCHGALAGKGGFRLSLRGYDSATDYFNIVKQDRGRRVEFAEPARSLLLAKPSGSIPHKGGLRLRTDSANYEILADWIANGASPPKSDDPTLTSLEVFPQQVKLLAGQQQQFIVRATYSDGRMEDVTRWTKWTSANETVCQVNDDGVVEVVGPGEGAISIWFSSQIVMARVTVPYQNEVAPDVFAGLKPKNFIDEEINRQLARLNIPPSKQCTDAEFIRRVYLDSMGILPTPEEVRNFIAKSDENKRDALVDAVLERPEFVDYWTYKWSDVLMLNGTLLRPEAVKAYYTWIHDNVEKNTPWDVMVREILTATGGSLDNGATNFYALNQTPEDMTENACQSFLGLSIGCAKCHNHPLEKWTNDQYYAMANLFSRVRAKGWGGESRNGDGKRTLYVVESGELVQPRTGKPQPPTPLDGTPVSFDDTSDRRIHLANWMTSPENPYFAKSITNRIWANFFGIGLVDSEDDLRVSNPASNPELLAASAKFLVDEKFNLKPLMREIMRSQAYQRSSEVLEGNKDESRFYSRYYPRRLMAEVLHDAIVSVTEVPTKFDSIAFPGADKQATDFYPVGTRAIQLYDSAVDSYFLEAFGRNPRNIVCECERSDEPSMVQVLHISNGHTINDKLSSKDGRVAMLLDLHAKGMSLESLTDEVFLTCLSRFPTEEERSQTVAILKESSAEEFRPSVQDLFWALLSSREFLFNH